MLEWDEYGEALLREGTQAWEAGKSDEAERLFNQLVNQFPERPEGYNKVGVVLAETGRLDEAEQCFLNALARDRMNAPALTNLGNIYLERGDAEQAIQHYLLALQSDQDYAPAHRNLGVAYRRQGRYSAYVSHYKRSQRLADRQLREEVRASRQRGRRSVKSIRLPGWVFWIIAAIGAALLISVIRR